VSGEPLESCCIVTVPAAPELEHVHHRMPVIIARERHEEWLRSAAGDSGAPGGLLVPWAHGGLEVRPVSRRVNDARNQGADLVDPLGTPADPA